MSDIALVLFDLNGVLYRYQREKRVAALAALARRSDAAIEKAIFESGFEDEGDAGALNAEAYLRGFGARIGLPLSEVDFVGTVRASLKPIAETLALLAALRPGVRRAVLTNNNLLIGRHFESLYPEVVAAGAAVFVSAEFRVRKPDPAVYRRCLQRLSVEPSVAVFVDDSAANVAGAVAAGLDGVVYAGAEGLADALRQRGVLA